MSKELEQAIIEKKRLFLFYGKEQFLIEKAIENVIAGYLSAEEKDFNLEVIESLPKDVFELINRCDTLPFMAQYRVVYLKDLSIFDWKDKQALERFGEEIEKLPETTILVVKESKVDKRKKIYKTIQKMGYLEEINFLSMEKMEYYLGKWFYRYKLRIKKSTISLLVQRAGADLTRLLKECEKLVAFADDVITDEMVLDLVSEQLESKIFRLTDALGERDRESVLANYKVMVQNKESLTSIHFMIVRQLKMIYETKIMMAEKASTKEMEMQLGVADFVVSKLIKQAKKFTLKELSGLLEELLQIEWDYKRGKLDLDTGLEMLFLRIS